jgi:hypothetical protein
MRLKVLLATIMMLAVLMSPSVIGEDSDGYHLVITYVDKEYGVGDDVDVTVHVFDKAQYVSVDNVTLMVGAMFDLREEELTEAGVGLWTGTFTIAEGDLASIGSFDYVVMTAEAVVESVSVESTLAMLMIPRAVEDPETLAISTSMNPSGIYMGPGEQKTITWEIRYQGDLVDATTMTSIVYEGSNQNEFTPTKSSTGIYTYEYTMPNGPRSVDVMLDLTASYDAGSTTVMGSADVSLYLNFLHVWAKKAAVSATTASFDLFVSNITGAPVEAAAITLDFNYQDDEWAPQQGSTSGTTDADGRAVIDLTYNDLGDEATEVEIRGKVIGQGKEQAIGFTMRVRAPSGYSPEPLPLGLDIIPEKDTADFDKAVNYPATAYYDGEPHGSSTVYWYAYTSHAVLTKGTENTNAAGDFSVDFRTPDKGTMDRSLLTTHFDAPVEDGDTYYYDDTEIMGITSISTLEEPDNPYDTLSQFKDSAVDVSVGKLEKNKDIPVTVTYSGADEYWKVIVMVGIDPTPSNMGLVPTWTYWSASIWEGAYGDICEYSGGKFNIDIFLPENLPNKDFYVGAVALSPEAMSSSVVDNWADYIKTNYVSADIGQSGSSGGGDGDGLMDRLMDEFLFGLALLYWIFILIIIVILGVVIGLMTTRKKGTKEIDEPGLEPTAEGPTFEGGPGAASMPMPASAYDEMQPVAGQAEYGAPPPVAPAQPEYIDPAAPPAADPYAAPAAYDAQQPAPVSEYGAPLPAAAPVQQEYAAPPPPVTPAQPEYAAPPPPVTPAQPEYAAPPPAMAPAQPEYAAPPPPVAPAQPEYAAPPPAMAPSQPEYQAPPPAMAPSQPEYQAPPPVAQPAPPQVPPQVTPEVPPQVPPPAPEAPPPAAPPVAAPPAAAPAAAAPAADPSATMTIRCQKCQTTLTIPRKRPIKVTCPNCGASGVLR